MPVEKAALELFVTEHRERVFDFAIVDLSSNQEPEGLYRIGRLLLDHGLREFVELDRERFLQRNFEGQTIPMEVGRRLQEEAVVARAFDVVAPIGVLMLEGMNPSTASAKKRAIDMQFELSELAVTEKDLRYVSRAQFFLRWGDKVNFTGEDRKILVESEPRLRIPFRRRTPNQILAWDYNQVVVTIWAEQIKVDFVPTMDEPNFRVVGTRDFLRDPQILVPVMQETFDRPQHHKVTAELIST